MSKDKSRIKEKTKIDEVLEASRRDFLKKVGIFGAASVAAAGARSEERRVGEL